MNVSETKLALRTMLEANVVTPLLVGERGIGKTEIVHEVAKELGFDGVIVIQIGQMSDAGDLLGLAQITTEGEVRYCKPNFFPRTGKFIVFLDEVNRVTDKSVFQSMFQFINEGKLGDYVLPSDCRIICAANPPKSRYSTYPIEEESAFMDRVGVLIFTPTVQDWINHMVSKYGESDETRFINAHPEMLDINDGEISLDDFNVARSRRSFTRCHLLRKVAQRLDVPDSLTKEIIAGVIGQTETATFYAWLDSNVVRVSAKDIVENGDLSNINKLLTRNDALTQLNLDLISYAKSFDGYLSLDHHKNIVRYVTRLPGEFGFSVYLELSKVRQFNEVDRENDKKQGLLYVDCPESKDILSYIRKFKQSAKKQEVTNVE